MLDHIGIVVRDYAKSRAFYERALRALGARMLFEGSSNPADPRAQRFAGFGTDRPVLWIGEGTPGFWTSEHQVARTPAHIALTCGERTVVDAFYHEAMAAGGTDHGAPGVRPQYHPTYYGAYVLDPDGNNVEAVCHMPM